MVVTDYDLYSYFATTFHQATAVLNESGDKGMTALLTNYCQLFMITYPVIKCF